MRQALRKAWFIALFAVFAHAYHSNSNSTSSSPSSPLHGEYSLACSACELFVREVARELSRLSPKLRASRVVENDANGEEREIMYEVR